MYSIILIRGRGRKVGWEVVVEVVQEEAAVERKYFLVMLTESRAPALSIEADHHDGKPNSRHYK